MKNNHGFSNILVIGLILTILSVGGYFIYNYVQKSNVEETSNDIVTIENIQNPPQGSIKENKDSKSKTDFELKSQEAHSLIYKDKNIYSLKRATKLEQGHLEIIRVSPSESEPWQEYLILIPNKKEELKVDDLKYLAKIEGKYGFKLYKNNFYFIDNNFKEIHKLNLNTLQETKLVVKNSPIKNFYIKEDNLYFINSEILYSLNLINNKITELANISIFTQTDEFKDFLTGVAIEEPINLGKMLRERPLNEIYGMVNNEIIIRESWGNTKERYGPYSGTRAFDTISYNLNTKKFSNFESRVDELIKEEKWAYANIIPINENFRQPNANAYPEIETILVSNYFEQKYIDTIFNVYINNLNIAFTNGSLIFFEK